MGNVTEKYAEFLYQNRAIYTQKEMDAVVKERRAWQSCVNGLLTRIGELESLAKLEGSDYKFAYECLLKYSNARRELLIEDLSAEAGVSEFDRYIAEIQKG